jgi:hypothetical protein
MWVERVRLFSDGMLIFPAADGGERLSRARNRFIYYLRRDLTCPKAGCPDRLVSRRGLIAKVTRVSAASADSLSLSVLKR